MSFRSLLATSIGMGLFVSACASDETSEDAGVRADAAIANHCPVYDGGKIEATGLFENEAFSVGCQFNQPGEEALYTAAHHQGYAKCKSLDGPDLSITIDVTSEPSETTYANADVIKVSAAGADLHMKGDASNRTKYSVDITCWNHDTLQLGGTFDAEWADDGTGTFPDPTAFTASGALRGSFMVRFNSP